MSNSTVSKLDFYRDFILSMISIVFGRLYPSLKVPFVDLSSNTAIITGGNSGIGLQIALEMARQGATVYLACRNPSKAMQAASEIAQRIPASSGHVHVLSLDTSSLSSVRSFAEMVRNLNTKIDLLFHNAGIGGSTPGKDFTSEGFPLHYTTNFLGSFLLTHLLEPYLADDARVILTSSTGQYNGTFSSTFSLNSIKEHLEPGFHAPVAAVKAGKTTADSDVYFAFTKLLQDHIDRKAKEAGNKPKRIVHAFAPGFTMTPIFGKYTVKNFWDDPPFWILTVTTFLATDVSQGAATAVWLASTQDDVVVGEGNGGGYWDRITRRLSSVDMMDQDIVERMWLRWEADAGIDGGDDGLQAL
ncbi:hypothetical protein OEA41_005551 [Lepraria neglecta]|uniref:NAD(P)-binding protein n=1 Tax=Lepraria neglecta TaxID=209136 RepID=A0AAD9ZHV5_9LECA|nr:hypothetical protein OEA41_005551 [Lepraria neglecta]